jgi:hypothetical protein
MQRILAEGGKVMFLAHVEILAFKNLLNPTITNLQNKI